MRVTREAEKEERRWDAFLSWRENPPTVGEGKNRTVIPFNSFLTQLGLGDEDEGPARTLTDEDIKRAFSKGARKYAVLPPGMKIEGN
jgi:hypothetical protein